MGFWDEITGKGTQQVVDEYTEIYGEILLGMDRKLKSVEYKINKFKLIMENPRIQDNLQNLDKFADEIEDSLASFENQLQQVRTSVTNLKKKEQLHSQQIANLNQKLKDLYMELQENKNHIQDTNANINAFKDKMTDNLEMLQTQNRRFNHELMQLEEKLNETAKDITEKFVNTENELNHRLENLNSNFQTELLQVRKKQKIITISSGIVLTILILWNIFLTIR
ncbi:hypothetical protein GCM10010978_32290 [Compostibacillus humi]|jgi:chromosome segregation ATPase|uniref:Uncharacterized protein n=1 Tax=Compostibacillus humi TaxID=1245525 RepID=A0A8J2TRX2_9BACI|nr:hypothetical protein [Compostibacillus humi]GFZ91058.1 hypothetical protein GCM10010978_32290 [Compostibacillus humi]